MKYFFIILFLFPSFILAQEKYERKFYELSENFDFKILSHSKVNKVDVATTGGAGTIYETTKKGYKAIFMWFKIKNKSNEKLEFDLRQFQVVDENSNVYDAYLCAGNNLNMKKCEDYDLKIKPNKGRQARVFFKPQIPKKTKLKYLRVSNVDLIEF